MKELKQLQAPYCEDARSTFVPKVNVDSLLKGGHQEVVCPKGNPVLVEAVDTNAGVEICFYCSTCKSITTS